MELQLFAKFITSQIDIPYEIVPHPGLNEEPLTCDAYEIKDAIA